MRDPAVRRWSRLHTRLYRMTNGLVGRRLVNNDMVLLTTKGHRTGRPHTVPLLFLRDGERLVVIASHSGRPDNPTWYHNLVDDPDVMVQIDGTEILMELVTHDGEAAPRLAAMRPGHELLGSWFEQLRGAMAALAGAGLAHGDLSPYNILSAGERLVIIDLPQAVNAAGNNQAFAMLERDVNNIRGTLGRFAPELLTTEYAREIWALFEAGELKPDSKLTGVFARNEAAPDTGAVIDVIEDAREEHIRRELGRLAG